MHALYLHRGLCTARGHQQKRKNCARKVRLQKQLVLSKLVLDCGSASTTRAVSHLLLARLVRKANLHARCAETGAVTLYCSNCLCCCSSHLTNLPRHASSSLPCTSKRRGRTSGPTRHAPGAFAAAGRGQGARVTRPPRQPSDLSRTAPFRRNRVVVRPFAPLAPCQTMPCLRDPQHPMHSSPRVCPWRRAWYRAASALP